jgi:restriction system protein
MNAVSPRGSRIFELAPAIAPARVLKSQWSTREGLHMARRRGSVFDQLLVLPWWVAVGLGVFGYAAVRFLLPAKGLEPLALIWLGLCGAAAAGSALRSFLLSRKFDRQRGLDDIRALSWRQFESIVGEAFRRRGYSVVENAVDGADGGIDLALRKDGERFVVQCKQWKQWTVGVKPVRELAGVIAGAEVAGGFFVISGRYTEEARRFASSVNIELIDGDALAEMIQGVQIEPALAPTSGGFRATTTWSNGTDAPKCPSCGSEMVGRTAKRGANAGSTFWGCSQYPRCRGTRAV